ncbi:MAG: YqaE/Pmp3 family membrane protein [Bacteroidia bacterium]
MKKIILLSSVVASALLLSCSSSINITKKHYSNGYNVSITKNETAKPNQTKNEVATTVTTATVVAEEQANVVAENNVVATTVSINTEEGTVNAPEFTETKTLIASNYTPVKTTTSIVKKMSAVKKIRSLKNTMAVGGGGDVSPVVLAILCIIIPPLAVFLKEGVTTNFWISLLLYVLLVTWIVSTVFAFLVCFDKI